jgi:nucleotide-binding universal stress UspA family protein
MKNILLALDLMHTDAPLIEYAKSMATAFNSKVWIVHIAAPEPDFVGYGVGPQYIRDNRADTLKNEHEQLHKLMTEFEGKNINCDALLISGPTIETIENEVLKLKIDLLIMGSHKHGFLYDTFVGHTSTKLVKALSIPLFIVPVKD